MEQLFLETVLRIDDKTLATATDSSEQIPADKLKSYSDTIAISDQVLEAYTNEERRRNKALKNKRKKTRAKQKLQLKSGL